MSPAIDATERLPYYGNCSVATCWRMSWAFLPEDAYRKAYDAHTQGWASELTELAELTGYLDAG
jgi:hypothetical protein